MTEHTGLSLAVAYRPRSFREVIGQDHVTTVLRNSVKYGALPQQLLFSGGSGLGKTTLARIAAAALLCETPLDARDDGDVCGECASCRDALDPARNHPDIIEFDAASHGGKDEIRDIAARTHVAPLRGTRKVYIIDEAHGLSGPGGQAFLKTLEEPPPHVVFMLCTTDPHKMLKTNRGRCVEFELVAPSQEQVAANLTRIAQGQNWLLPPEVVASVIQASDPDLGVRGTVSTLARVGSLFEEGGQPSESLIAAVLGTAPPSAVKRLCHAIEQCDRVRALKELSSLRTVTSDTAIRTALRLWANDRVQRSLGQDPESVTAALWALEQVMSCPPSREWLDLLVARISSPEIDGPAEATLHPARELLLEIRQAVEDARTARASLDPAPPVANPSSLSSTMAQVLVAASPAPAGLSEVLSLCDVSLTDEHLFIAVPTEFTARVAPFNAVLKTAAARLGVSLRLRRKAQ